MASTDILVAKETFTANLDGQPVTVIKGQTRVRAGHPLLKGREMYFEPLTVHYDVEKATASPGEKRGAPDADRQEALKAATAAANAARNAAKSAAAESKAEAESKDPDTGDNGSSASS